MLDDHEVEYFFDSGATSSLIALRLVKQFQVEILPSSVQIKSANNEVNPVVGVTPLMTINIHNHFCDLPLLVMDLHDYDVLLGLNWFEKTKAGIFPAQRMLKFESEIINLTKPNFCDDNIINEINIAVDEDNFMDMHYDIVHDDAIRIVPNTTLSSSEQTEFCKLVPYIKEIVACSYNDLGCCEMVEHRIITVDVPPIYIPNYRRSLLENKYLNDEVQLMLEAGIIQHSTSPWSASALLIPKPDKSYRLCIDYRKLNAITIADQFPLPRVVDIIDSLSGDEWFTVIDLKSGYWQVKLDKQSIPKTAFTTTNGHFEFLRTPFGLRNAPAQFSRLMVNLFGKFSFVSVYLDDLTIHSKIFFEHIHHVKAVIDILKQANLRINIKKCVWFAKSIKLLGHLVSGGSVSMDPDKVSAILNRLPPTNVKQVQEFLGLPNYYRRHIKDFAKIIFPINNLLKNNVPFVWDRDCEDAFQLLKKKVTEYPILKQPDFDKQFVLHCDASGYALGAVLAQVEYNCSNVYSYDYVVAYASRVLKNAELNYAITHKECLALVWGIKYFHNYLYGVKFVVITDHIALSWLNHSSIKNGQLARWAISLSDYNFEIKYRMGKLHGNVDTLSRPVLSAIASVEIETAVDKIIEPYQDDFLLYFLKHQKHLPGSSKKKIKRIEKQMGKYKYDLENDTLYYRQSDTSAFLKIPKLQDRHHILEIAHLLGHFNALTTINRIKNQYWWPKMLKDAIKIVNECFQCKANNVGRIFFHRAQSTRVSSLFERIAIDLVLGLPVVDSFLGILVITEMLSRYPYAVAIKSKTAVEISGHLFIYISLFGPPQSMGSDNGSEFVNEIVDTMLSNIGIEHRVTSAYHPNTNGQCERFNATLISSLRKHCEKHPTDWVQWLPFVLMSYRSRIHSTTGHSPFSLMFGREMNTFSNWRNDDLEQIEAIETRAVEIKRHVEETIPDTIRVVEDKQDRQKSLQDNSHTVLDDPLEVGCIVYLKNEGLLTKLHSRYSGPYTIVNQTKGGNYKLKDSAGTVLRRPYPLEKLKLTKDQNIDNIYAVEKIINDRVFQHKQQYLVKWKDFSESENSWENEDNFVNTVPIKIYWKLKDPINANNSKQRRSKRLEKINTLSILPSLKIFDLLIIIFLLCLLVQQIVCFTVTDDFRFCDGISNVKPVELKHVCQNKLIQKFSPFLQLWQQSYNRRMKVSILSKVAHAVSGSGY